MFGDTKPFGAGPAAFGASGAPAAPSAPTSTPASMPVGAGVVAPAENEDNDQDNPTTSLGGMSPRTQFYAGGGAIDEDTGDVNSPMGGLGGAGNLQSALSVVQEVLSYGRKLHGLGGEQQAAARMPVAPGTQSESGRREQPVPGPLPPAKTPFGKRADAEEAEPAQEQVAEAEAIPTDDEEMA